MSTIEPKSVTLKTGETCLIRSAREEDVPQVVRLRDAGQPGDLASSGVRPRLDRRAQAGNHPGGRDDVRGE